MLTGADDNRSYRPDPDYYGKDSFTFVANDGRAIAAFKPHGHQGAGDMPDVFEIRVPGNVVPQAEFFLAHGDPITPPGHRSFESYRNRLVIFV